MKRDEFWPVVLQTSPPTLLTREEAYARVPAMHVTHIAATNPRSEHDSAEDFPIPENHLRMRIKENI